MHGISKNFFPDMYHVVKSEENDNCYHFVLISISDSAKCPKCMEESARKFSYQDKNPRDLPIFGKPVLLTIKQKRYFCDNKKCGTDVFTERNDFVDHYSQFTKRCRSYMLKVADYVGCETASKILKCLGIRVSDDTLLSMRKQPKGKNSFNSQNKSYEMSESLLI